MVFIWPYLLGQIGLVGNFFFFAEGVSEYTASLTPYLLGQIGLVGNFKECILKYTPEIIPTYWVK